jgi:hypothetical protein
MVVQQSHHQRLLVFVAMDSILRMSMSQALSPDQIPLLEQIYLPRKPQTVQHPRRTPTIPLCGQEAAVQHQRQSTMILHLMKMNVQMLKILTSSGLCGFEVCLIAQEKKTFGDSWEDI